MKGRSKATSEVELEVFREACSVIQAFIADAKRKGLKPNAIVVRRCFPEFVGDNRTFPKILRGQKQPHEEVRTRLIAFASYIRTKRKHAMNRFPAPKEEAPLWRPTNIPLDVPLNASEPQSLIRTAIHFAHMAAPRAAITLAESAFLLAFDISADDGLTVLPQTLYVIHRYGSLQDCEMAIEHTILPRVGKLNKPSKAANEGCVASVALLACMLNEGGRLDEVKDIFSNYGIATLKNGSLRYPWLPAALIRNEALHVAWREGAGGAAKSILESAKERDEASGKSLSTDNTNCEILLAVGSNRLAAESIERSFHLSKIELARMISKEENVPARLMHSYGAFLLGIFAGVQAGTYSEAELSNDLSIVDTIARRVEESAPRSTMKIAHRKNTLKTFPHHEEILTKFNQIETSCSREHIRPRLFSLITSLIKALEKRMR